MRIQPKKKPGSYEKTINPSRIDHGSAFNSPREPQEVVGINPAKKFSFRRTVARQWDYQ